MVFIRVDTGEEPKSEIGKLARKYPQLVNEIEAREVVMRAKMTPEQRQEKMPSIGFLPGALEIYRSFDEGKIDEASAIDKLTDLLEAYYDGKPYPLR